MGQLDQILDLLAEKLASRLTDTPSPNHPRLLTVEQAAVYLGRSRDAVGHLIASGKIPRVSADRRVFLDLRDLDRWIEENKERGI